jgi:hypothetical protein
VIPDESARAVHLAEDLGFVGAAIVVEIAQADDAAALWFAAQRAIAIATDIERAIGAGCDEDRIVRGGAVREKCDFEVIRDLDVFEDGGFLPDRQLGNRRSNIATFSERIVRLRFGCFFPLVPCAETMASRGFSAAQRRGPNEEIMTKTSIRGMMAGDSGLSSGSSGRRNPRRAVRRKEPASCQPLLPGGFDSNSQSLAGSQELESG